MNEVVVEAEVEEAPLPIVVEETGEASRDVDDAADGAIPRLKGKKGDAPRESKSMNALRNNEDRALKEWMEELSPGGQVKVKIIRTSPKIWRGMNVGGSLATYDHQIDEEWIREHHGGGNFQLEVRKPRTNGSGWVYAGGRAIQIAGDPRTDDVFRNKEDVPAAPVVAAAPAAGSAIVDKTFSVLERELENARRGSGADVATMQLMLAPLQTQIEQLSRMLQEKDRQLAAAQQPRPVERDEFRDRMLATMLEGDSARLSMMRAQHESEIRQLKESAMQNESRLRDSFERDKQNIAMSHERELNAIRGAYDLKVASQEQSHTTGRSLMEAEIRRLQSDLTEAKAELAALRLKKDKTILEQATEFAAIKEAIGEITGNDKEEKSTIEKVIEAAGSIPAVQGVIGRFAGGGDAQSAQPQVQQPVVQPRLLTGPDGNLYQQLPDGRMRLIRRRAALQQAAPQGVEASGPQIPEIAPATIKISVDYLESAYRNGQDPTEVATSVRSMIPVDVINAIRKLGIDGFLTNVAKLDASSPLSSQAGRNWTRKLGKALLGDA